MILGRQNRIIWRNNSHWECANSTQSVPEVKIEPGALSQQLCSLYHGYSKLLANCTCNLLKRTYPVSLEHLRTIYSPLDPSGSFTTWGYFSWERRRVYMLKLPFESHTLSVVSYSITYYLESIIGPSNERTNKSDNTENIGSQFTTIWL